DSITDFLAISYSSTDYVGHNWGVNSKEIQDTYMRLDLDLERLLKSLDDKVGVGEYTVFLTADHAAVQVPAYLKDNKVPAGYLDFDDVHEKLNDYIRYTYGATKIISNISNDQVFLDHKALKNLDMDIVEIQNNLARELMRHYNNIYKVYIVDKMVKDVYIK